MKRQKQKINLETLNPNVSGMVLKLESKILKFPKKPIHHQLLPTGTVSFFLVARNCLFETDVSFLERTGTETGNQKKDIVDGGNMDCKKA